MFKDCLKELGCDSSLYGLHSLRAGGATAVVNSNNSISERLLMIHGRWKTHTAKDMYIHEDVSSRLEVTGHRGI